MNRFVFICVFLSSVFCGLDETAWAQTPTRTPCCQGLALSAPITNLNSPLGMAANVGSGLVMVADANNHALRVYDSTTGSPVTSLTNWGTSGSFGNIDDVAVDSDGHIYAADFGYAAVFEFNSSYGYMATIGLGTFTTGVRGVAVVSQSGITSLYAVTGGGLVYRFDSTDGGNTYNPTPVSPSPFGYGASSTPIAILALGNTVFVVDDAGTIMGLTGPSYTPIVEATPGLGPLGSIRADLAGNIYVTAEDGYLLKYLSGINNAPATCSLGNALWGMAVAANGNIFMDETVTGSVTVLQGCVLEPTPTPFYGGANPPTQDTCFIYPSPARGDHAAVSYDMAESGIMDLKILNENGELAADITDRKVTGVQVTPFQLSPFSPGIYYYVVTLHYDSGRSERLKTGKFVVTR